MRYLSFALVFFFCSTLIAYADQQERHYISENHGLGMSNMAISATTGFIASSHENLNFNAVTQKKSRYTELKGAFGESLMDYFFTETGGWQRIESAKVSQGTGKLNLVNEGSNSKTGLDGIYIKFNDNGTPKDLMVGEAKVNSSKLRMTKSGMQMSPEWRNQRLFLTAQRYSNAGKAFREGTYNIAFTPPLSNQESTTIPNGRNGKITFWFDGQAKQWRTYTEPFVTGKQVADKLDTLASYIKAAAQGEVTYRARLFTIDARTSNINIRIINAETGTFESKPIVNEFKNLPVKVQNAIRGTLRQTIVHELTKNGQAVHIAESNANKVTNYAEKTGSMHDLINKFYPKNAWHQQLLARPVLLGTISGGALAGVFDLGFQARSGQIDLRQLAVISSLGGVSGGAAWGGIKMEDYLAQDFLQSPALGLSQSAKSILAKLGGGFTGGGIASLLFAYGGYLGGYMDREEAKQTVISGLIGTGVGAGFGIAVTSLVSVIGTAGTGAAITGMSGIAATNASLAWLGGGTLAAGGLGVAGGALILSGGTMVIAIAATWVITSIYSIFDAETRQNIVFQLIKTIRSSKEEEIKLLYQKGI